MRACPEKVKKDSGAGIPGIKNSGTENPGTGILS